MLKRRREGAMHIRLGVVAALAVIAAAPALAAPADGFGVFWPKFVAAAAKDDKPALAAMTALGPGLGDDGASFAKFHADHLGAAARRCLVKAKPVRDVDPQGGVNYSAFCGEIIYGFSKNAGAWKLTDLGAND
ncbi:MAG TPA: hypothetical protein VN814_11200 [Caulobacteraceae bacterium]|nr:hypothetical protein [Caulobacteraceae bacterium]